MTLRKKPLVLLMGWLVLTCCLFTIGGSVSQAQECTISLTCVPLDTIYCIESADPDNTGRPTVDVTCPPYDLDYTDDTIPGDCIGTFVIVRTWIVTDVSANADTCVQVIQVLDYNAPELTCPDTTYVECPEDIPAVGEGVVVTDACDPDPVVTLEDADTTGTCPRIITRYYIARDDCGNADKCYHTIIVEDTTPPVLKCPPDDTISCEVPLVWTTPPYDDNCPDGAVVSVLSTDTVITGDETAFTRCWVVTDFCGLADTCCQTIIQPMCDTDTVVVGQPCTFTQGGWGNTCPRPQIGDLTSTQPGCVRDNFFDEVFPNGVVIGDPSGFTATFTSAAAVQEYLPTGGKPGALTEDVVDPEQKSLNVLASQILALTLNVEYSCAGVFEELGLTEELVCLGDVVIGEECGGEAFEGLTVSEFLAVANLALSGDLDVLEEYDASYSDINETASCLNESYHCGDGDGEDEEEESPESSREDNPGKAFGLQQNRPNPFNPTTTISLNLPVASDWSLTIYNIRGQKVAEYSGYNEAGTVDIVWDASGQASGVYLYRMSAGDYSETRKMLLLK